MDYCLQKVLKRVIDDMNAMLLKQFSPAKVKQALDQMVPLKLLGPDGSSACFYQSYWNVLSPKVCFTILPFLNDDHFDPWINPINIILIPKIAHPTHPSDFRPISLCNVIYKLVSKVLANRLKPILESIISPT